MKIQRILIGAFFLSVSAYATAQSQSADDYYRLGSQLHYDAKYDSAARIFERAGEAFRNVNDTIGWIRSAYEKGESLANMGACEEAKKTILAATNLSLNVAGGSDTLTARGYYHLSRAIGGCSRDFSSAIALLKKSIRIRSALRADHPLLGYDYTTLGYYYNSVGKHDSALYYLNKAVDIRTSQRKIDSLELSHTLFNLAKSYESLGDVFTALELGERSLGIRQKYLHKNHPTISNSLSDIGTVYRTVGNYDRALPYIEQALDIRKETLGENHVNVGASYYTIGVLYGSMFNYQRAIHFIEQGNLIIQKALGENTPVLHTYFAYLGSMYGHVGRHSEAERYLMKARALGEKYLDPNHLYLGIIYGIIGKYYAETSAIEDQIIYLNKAREIFQQALGPISIREIDVLIELGEGYLLKDELKMAESHFQDALRMSRKLLGTKNPKASIIHQDLGDIYSRTGERELALGEYLESLNAVSLDSIRSDLGVKIPSLTHKRLALITLRKIASLYRSFGNEESLASAHARYLLAIDLIDAISQDYDLEVSRAQLGEDTRQVFEQAVSVAYSLYRNTGNEKYKRDAFRIVEKSKSPILLSKIKDTEVKRSLGVPDDVISVERDMAIQLAYYKRKLKEVERNDSLSTIYQDKVFTIQTKSDSLKDQLEKNYPEYFEFKYEDKISEIDEIQNQLDGTTLVLEYFLTDTTGYVFDITTDHFEMRKFEAQSDLMNTITSYMESLTNADRILNDSKVADSLFVNSSFHLYRKLVGPALSANSDKQRLTIIPDGVLSQVNFNVFIRSKPGVINYAALDYLMRQYDVSYAYSATLGTRSTGSPRNLSFAGFAPSYNSELYSGIDSVDHPMTYELVREGKLPLPGAIAEVSEIGRLMNGETWLNVAASETNFKLNSANYGILHLAMHSLLNMNDPQYSELLFNDEKDSTNDGFLAIDEIYNLNLDAQMVVLSACSSGSGALQVGEGPISFSRAFSYAGCPSVVMSMWKVPDKATSQIMIEFYKNIKNGNLKDEALRRAQLSYLRNEKDPLRQHPFYWAGFVAMGDTQPIGRKSEGWMLWVLAGIVVLTGGALVFRRRFSKS